MAVRRCCYCRTCHVNYQRIELMNNPVNCSGCDVAVSYVSCELTLMTIITSRFRSILLFVSTSTSDMSAIIALRLQQLVHEATELSL